MASHGVPRVSGSREKDAEKEQRNIAQYRQLVDQVHEQARLGDFSKEALTLISKLLSKNPEYYTVWNIRRCALQQQLKARVVPAFDLITSDLNFLIPLLVQFPKCYWIWNYRAWVLDQAEQNLDSAQALQIWSDEMALVSKMLTRDERNFHGWGYRRHIVSQIERIQDPATASLVESEFEYTTKMIRKALQNFSALHYRSKLIPRLLNERKASPADRRKFFNQELDMMQEALIDPFNQSAWFYHQYLMSTLDPASNKDDFIIIDLADSDRLMYYEQEIDRIKEMLEDFDDCKWIYQALLQYHQDIDDSNFASQIEVRQWLSELQRLDPMRANRWRALKSRLNL